MAILWYFLGLVPWSDFPSVGWVGFHSLSGFPLSKEISLAPPLTQHTAYAAEADLTLGYSSERTSPRLVRGRQATVTGVDRLYSMYSIQGGFHTVN